MAEVRAQVWRRSAATTGGNPVVLDIDASLVDIHSENKDGTAPTYKGGFGFHPCSASPTPPVRPWPACCGRATPGRTPSPIT
jgi:hypothetical protein